MRSVEHLIEQHHLAQESKTSLALKITFEQYQDDFSISEKELGEAVLLDVGTGTGEFVHYLKKILGNDHVYGVDFNISTPSPDHPYLAHGDIQALPYADNLFDITLSRNVLHGIFFFIFTGASTEKALSELLRITKNGGQILYAIKSPEAIKKAILKDIQKKETQEELLMRLRTGVETEALYLQHLQTLGNTISVVFRGSRKIVKIHKRTVQ